MLRRPLLLAFSLAVLATPAMAQQQSEGYKFLQAVEDEKPDVVTQMVEKPGSTIINVKGVTSGDGALHIVVKHDNAQYLNYLLGHGADANIRDKGGNTPLVLATSLGKTDLIPILLRYKANPNLGNTGGETPLIIAVQHRDRATVEALLAAGGDPDIADTLAGLSARDYANRDTRSTVLAKLFADTPKKTRRAVAGPKF